MLLLFIVLVLVVEGLEFQEHIFVFLVHILTVFSAYLHAYFDTF